MILNKNLFLIYIDSQVFSKYVYLSAMRLIFFFSLITLNFYAQKNNELFDQKIFWEVSTNTNPTFKHYLFASFPSNDKRVFDLPDSLYVVMKRVENLLLERNYFQDFVQADSRLKLPRIKLDNDGLPFSTSSEATQTVFGSEFGMPQFLEMHLLEYMTKLKKRVIHLDNQNTVQFWNELRDYKKNIFISTNLKYRKEQFLQLYLKKDIYELDRFLRNYLSKKDSSYYKLIETNSMEILDEIIEFMNSQSSSLLIIGAQYLGGKKGIISGLRKKGFRLRPVQWSVSNNNTLLKKEFLENRQTNYYDSVSMLHVRFPGTPFIKYHLDGSKELIYRELGQGNSYFVEIIPRNKELSEEQMASIHIQSPLKSFFKKSVLDNGTIIYEGLSDTYREGFCWTRVLFSESHYVVCKSFGGNFFINSNRSIDFFNSVWFDKMH